MEKKYPIDYIQQEQAPDFTRLVELIEKNFKDYLEQSKALTPEEIEAGWRRYKTLNHLYQDEPATSKDAVWVKASERLPGWRVPVKWKSPSGNEQEKKYPLFQMTDSGAADEFDGWEWLDESGQSQQPGREVKP